MRLPWYLSLLLFSCLLLPGCLKNTAQDGPQVPQFSQTSEEQIADDIKIVRNMLVHKMRGLTTPLPAALAFAPQGTHNVQEAGFDYRGFTYKALVIIDFVKRQKNNDTEESLLLGALLFADGAGRKTSASFSVAYEIDPKKLTITESIVKPLSSISPEILCFIVPQEAYTKAASSLTSFEAWAEFAVKNAVDMNATKANPTATAAPSRTQRYTVIALSMDRVLPPSAFRMGLAPDEKAPIANANQARFENYNGWQIGILDAELDLDNPANKVHLRVDYTPDPAIRPPDAQATYPVGIFALQKNLSP